MPLASVIIPAFNAEASIEAAVASVQQQTVRDLEILVIDDASQDDTYARVLRLAAQDPRIKPSRNSRNCGPGVARNIGLDRATGDWIALLDADDHYCTQRIAALCALGAEHGADIVADNVRLYNESDPASSGLLIPREQLTGNKWLGATEFVEGNMGGRGRTRRALGFLKPMVRRTFLERSGVRYDEARFAEDFLFYLKCLMQGAAWLVTSDAMYCYTIRESSLTDGHSEEDLAYLSAVEHTLLNDAFALDPALAAVLRRHKKSVDDALCWFRFARAVKRRDWRTARRSLLRDPRSFVHVCHEGLRALPRAAAGAASRCVTRA